MKINRSQIAGIKHMQFLKYLAIMKATFILVFVSIFQVSANTYAQKLTFSKKNVAITEIFREIKKQTNYNVICNAEIIKSTPNITIDVKNTSLTAVLEKVLAPNMLSFVIDKDAIIVNKMFASNGLQPNTTLKQNRVSGSVRNHKNEPLIGVSIRVKGKDGGVVSDIKGQFVIEASRGDILVFSSIGFTSIEITIENGEQLNIQLLENISDLQDVVVTALGIKREEKALGYAVQEIKGEALQSAKGVDIATSLTGKIAGLNIKNSTEFNSAPSIQLRGQSPLIVVDGVATQFVSMRDIPADNVESIDVLKGATASALYGSRGGSGAIMITTKRGSKGGLSVNVNTSTMFNAGYLARPEVQSSYSTGQGGKYLEGSYVWGDKLDIGRKANIYNPISLTREETLLESKGKRNLENFQEMGLITNSNVSISQRGEYGGIRASFTHVYNKGQYENNKLNKFTYSVIGDMKADRFNFEGGLTYNKRFYPNMGGTGYGGGGFLYNLTVWSGTEYDIRDYADYWVIPNEKQNWMDASWYDNPYFIANEITHSNDYDVLNGFFSAVIG